MHDRGKHLASKRMPIAYQLYPARPRRRYSLPLRVAGVGLWLLLLLAARAASAQRGHAYWDANPDSLARLLARTPAGPTRLLLLRQLVDLRYSEPRLRELTALASQLRRPEYPAYRAWLVAATMSEAWSGESLAATARALDSSRVAIARLDSLGEVAYIPLADVNILYRLLHQPEAHRAYFERQLAYYRVHGPVENIAQCLHSLGGASVYLGDYNRTISYYLQAVDYYRLFSFYKYYDDLGVIGDLYADWGNPDKALYYLRQAASARAPITRTYAYRALARLYLHQRQYPAALRAADQAYRAAAGLSGSEPTKHRAYALALRAAIEVAQGLPTAGRTLAQVQHLADSLHLPLSNRNVDFELDAAWARYYEGRGEWARAEASWQLAYRKARQCSNVVLQLAYLRQLARFYHARGQLAPSARHYYQVSQLTDSIEAQQHFRIAQYEVEREAHLQESQLAQARQQQQRTSARVQAQQRTLWGLAAGLTLLAAGAALLWQLNRQKQRANALLAAQKVQLQEQAERLGELDEAKNQFFANVSHELRTPLTLVLGPLDSLLTDAAHPLPPPLRRPVALAYTQAQRLAQLVNRILDLTKLEAGRLALSPQPTDLAALLRRVVGQFESLANQRGQILPAPTGLPPTELHLLLDAEKVEEILTNLLSNALKHTPAGGQVQVHLDLPAAAASQYAVTVRDTGPGLAEAEQTRVFERFYQTPQGQAQGGTGLGLALSRELAHLLGGSLTLASTPGQGAAFTLRFPAEAVAVATVPAPVEPAGAAQATAPTEAVLTPAPGQRSRVLVVEDQPDLREYLRSLLAATCEVLVAPDGQAALELLANQEGPQVDLLLTDAMMPRLSGTELLAQLRADPNRYRTAGVPVLMLTARADVAHRHAALTVGVDDYLTKPFIPAELLARVQTLLARRQVRRHFAALPPAEPLPPPAEPLAAAATAPAPRRRPAASPEATGAQLARWQAQVATRLADEHFGPAELADLLCLSERTLYRRLGELAGLTPAAWLRELRLDKARQLLEAGHFGTVAAVADAVGFASAKYFASVYAERFGRRPADYQAMPQHSTPRAGQ